MNPEQSIPADDPNSAVGNLSYEAARDELVSIVTQLEGGQLGLAESMRLWERGEALADHCERWLDGAEQRLAAGRGQRSAGVAHADADRRPEGVGESVPGADVGEGVAEPLVGDAGAEGVG
ncbi:Exodeoxyribonuclease 7 small subunit [Austwickia sp. TVS 96-490-7B]|nr:Exodeoxyribonuclease 7 small subunit [Austwickia sp. TVS 96-490-7B]